ncbi:MAG: 4-(cytidine 5'-diphospho)-2-C-methyl-D-erythritol kinase [Bacteroidales bacterium]|nr:4-(cytidine 5'-diphospho)-2-C-methyl-D-erythritol kinase [Bacteroidales bacterium]
MVIFPNAKINIGLYITGKRDDGYHNIESLFYPTGLQDALEFVVQPAGSYPDEFTVTGIETDCSIPDNLVMKAINLLRKDYNIPPLKIHLHKTIPAGAGLGGGSSDAAFMLRYLNRYFSLGLDNDSLINLALKLGSDCAFFIRNKPSIIRGRGDIIKEVQVSLEGKYLLLVHPGIHISTAEAYSMLKVDEREADILEDRIKMPLSSWKNNITNDFQDIIISRYPVTGDIIDAIYDAGAIYCSMSGSGSAIYGIFRELPGNYFSGTDYWIWKGSL